jgi:hypothetical protein
MGDYEFQLVQCFLTTQLPETLARIIIVDLIFLIFWLCGIALLESYVSVSLFECLYCGP